MICPNCKVQMHQHEKIGGGEATDQIYKTWEVKQCPVCKRTVRESYIAEVITRSQVARLKLSMDTDIIID